MPRSRAWGTTMFNALFATDGTQLLTNLLSGLTELDTVTAVRLVVHLGVVPNDLLGAIDGTVFLDVGIGVAAKEAFDAGVVPDPDSGDEMPARGWLWRDRLWLSRGTDAVGHVMVAEGVRADLRAARRVDRGVLYMVTRSSLCTGTFAAPRLVGLVRALCLT